MAGATLEFQFSSSEAKILALTPTSEYWKEQAFYYPDDKSYFYQVRNGVMKRYGGGDIDLIGTGVKLNGLVLGSQKTLVESYDLLYIPELHDYNTFSLSIEGEINNCGQINIM